MRATDLRRPFHGVRGAAIAGPESAEEAMLRRAHEYAVRMRDVEFFSHVTAAVLWGLPLPWSTLRIRDGNGHWMDRRLDVSVLLPARAARSAGVVGHSALPSHASVTVHPEWGLRLTDPATTWAMLGGILRRYEDLVAVGDAIVRERMHRNDPVPLADVAGLEAALKAGRRRGAKDLRAALPLIRTRSRSRQETRLRLLLHAHGLPEPELNWPVVDAGVVIAVPDLAYPHLTLGLDYEGEHHLTDARQWAADIRRYEALAALGWRVMRVTKGDLAENAGTFVARVRAAIASRR